MVALSVVVVTAGDEIAKLGEAAGWCESSLPPQDTINDNRTKSGSLLIRLLYLIFVKHIKYQNP